MPGTRRPTTDRSFPGRRRSNWGSSGLLIDLHLAASRCSCHRPPHRMHCAMLLETKSGSATRLKKSVHRFLGLAARRARRERRENEDLEGYLAYAHQAA